MIPIEELKLKPLEFQVEYIIDLLDNIGGNNKEKMSDLDNTRSYFLEFKEIIILYFWFLPRLIKPLSKTNTLKTIFESPEFIKLKMERRDNTLKDIGI